MLAVDDLEGQPLRLGQRVSRSKGADRLREMGGTSAGIECL